MHASSWLAANRTRCLTILTALSALCLLTYPLPSAWLGLGTLVAAGTVGWRRLVLTLRRSVHTLPLMLYLFGAVVGLLTNVTGPLLGEVRFFGLLAALVIFYLMLNSVTSGPAARRSAIGMLVATVLAAPVVFVLTAPILELRYLPRPLSDLVTFVEPAGVVLRKFIFEDAAMIQRYRLYDSGLGGLAAYGVGLTLGPALSGCLRRTRLLGWAAMLYFACFLVLSTNRGAIVTGVFLVLVAGSVRYRWLPVVALLFAACTAGLIVVSLASTQDGLANSSLGLVWQELASLGSIEQRLDLWRNSLFLLGDFWFTGVGLGLHSVSTVYSDYFLPINPAFHHAHNFFVQSYLEQGLLGLSGIVGLIIVTVVVGWRTLMRVRDPAARSSAISAGCAALALVLSGLTEIVAVTTIGMVLLFAALGLLFGIDRLQARLRSDASADTPSAARWEILPRGRVLLIAMAAILLLAVLPVAFNRSLGLPLPSSLKEPVRAVVARLYLNFGVLELAKGMLRDGTDRERSARLERAEDFLSRARNLDPNVRAIDRVSAALALAYARPAETLELLDSASTRTTMDDRQVLFQLGRLYRQAGAVDQAITTWTRAGAFDHLIKWGSELVEREEWELALRVNLAGIRVAPTQPVPYRSLRLAVQRQQDSAAALLAMQELAITNSTVPWPYFEIGEVYAEMGRVSEARVWYERAAAIAPDNPLVRLRLRQP